MKVEDRVLIHFTKSAEAVISILKLGFFYSYRNTGTFQQLFDDAGIDVIESDKRGMVCFTTDYNLIQFGDYGIAVNFQWALLRGVRAVQYVDCGDYAYNSYLNRLKLFKPKLEPTVERVKIEMFQVFAGHPAGASMYGAGQPYIDILEALCWVQEGKDKEQKEWRIRNPNQAGGIQWKEPDMKHPDRLNRNMPFVKSWGDNLKILIKWATDSEMVRENLFLSIPKIGIHYIIVPLCEAESFKKLLEENSFTGIEIVER